MKLILSLHPLIVTLSFVNLMICTPLQPPSSDKTAHSIQTGDGSVDGSQQPSFGENAKVIHRRYHKRGSPNGSGNYLPTTSNWITVGKGDSWKSISVACSVAEEKIKIANNHQWPGDGGTLAIPGSPNVCNNHPLRNHPRRDVPYTTSLEERHDNPPGAGEWNHDSKTGCVFWTADPFKSKVCPDAVPYHIKAGETLWGLGHSCNINGGAIRHLNYQIVDPTKIQVGADIRLPQGCRPA